jgi:hypothetical protein
MTAGAAQVIGQRQQVTRDVGAGNRSPAHAGLAVPAQVRAGHPVVGLGQLGGQEPVNLPTVADAIPAGDHHPRRIPGRDHHRLPRRWYSGRHDRCPHRSPGHPWWSQAPHHGQRRPTPRDDELKTVNDIKVRPELQPLYDYLAWRGSFVHLDNYRPEFLPIFSRDVLRRIAANDDTWESMVPPEVAELIKRRAFFGYIKLDTD